MSAFPGNNRLTRTVRRLAEDNHTLNAERMIFLGPHGEMRDVIYPDRMDDISLRDRRAEMLRTGEVAALAHLGASSIPSIMQFHMIEIYTAGVPILHSLVTWPHEYRWIAVPQDASNRWLEMWREGGSKT